MSFINVVKSFSFVCSSLGWWTILSHRPGAWSRSWS